MEAALDRLIAHSFTLARVSGWICGLLLTVSACRHRARHPAAPDVRGHDRRRQRACRLRAGGVELVGLHGRAGAPHARAHRLGLHASVRAHPRAARHHRARGVHLLPRFRHLLRLQGARTVDRIQHAFDFRARRAARDAAGGLVRGLRRVPRRRLRLSAARHARLRQRRSAPRARVARRALGRRGNGVREGKPRPRDRGATDDTRRHPRPAAHSGARRAGRGRPRLARHGAQPALLADLADRDHRRSDLVDHDLVHPGGGAVLRADGRDHAAHRHGRAHVCGDRPMGVVAARRADAFQRRGLRGVGRAVRIERRDRGHGRHRRDRRDQEAQIQRAAVPRHDRGRRHARHPHSAVDQHGRLWRDDRHLDPEALSRGLHSGLRALVPVHGDRADRLPVAAGLGRHAGRHELGGAHPHPARPAAAARHPRRRDRLDLYRLGDRHRGRRARHSGGLRLRGL